MKHNSRSIPSRSSKQASFHKADMAKMMKKITQENIAARENKTVEAADAELAATEQQVGPKLVAASTTNLMFYRQYYTYQGCFSVWGKNALDNEAVFKKVILYIVKWFKNRVGEEQLQTIEEIKFLRDDYPEPEGYKDFDLCKIDNIDIGTSIDVRSLYWQKENSWSFRLEEPDNNNENTTLRGRVFITDVSVKMLQDEVMLSVRVTCKEPHNNTVDAAVYRPSFVRNIFLDDDLTLGEFGVPKAYAFGTEPVHLNGKSGTDCEALYNDLIMANARQMPVVFMSEDYYNSSKADVDAKTVSCLGFGHFVVIDSGVEKFFHTTMNNDEYVDVMKDNQIILYEQNETFGREFATKYFDTEESDSLKKLSELIKKEPLRKAFSYGKCPFYNEIKSKYIEVEGTLRNKDSNVWIENEKLKQQYKTLEVEHNEVKRDAAVLQERVTKLEAENKDLEEQREAVWHEHYKLEKELSKIKEELAEEKEKNKNQNSLTQIFGDMNHKNEKAKYKPLLNFPAFEMSAKDDILRWIEEYYSDLIIVHSRAAKAFKDDKRNLDWKTFCLMIHYLAGYTEHRNHGGIDRGSDIARDYDPEDKAFAVERSSSGSSGSSTIYKDKYSIDISQYDNGQKIVLLDMHMKQGKGRGDDMIRIYFYYDADIKKSIIGYMPDHLPTRADGH